MSYFKWPASAETNCALHELEDCVYTLSDPACLVFLILLASLCSSTYIASSSSLSNKKFSIRMLQKNLKKIFNCKLCKQVALKNAVCFPKIAEW